MARLRLILAALLGTLAAALGAGEVDELLAQLKQADPAIQRGARDRLRALSEGLPSATLAGWLGAEDPVLMQLGAEGLGFQGTRASGHGMALLRAQLRHPKELRSTVQLALFQLQEPAAIIRALDSPVPGLALAAADFSRRWAWAWDPQPDGLAPALAAALRRGPAELSSACEDALALLGPPARPALTALLKAEEAPLRAAALRILGRQQSKRPSAVRALLPYLDDPDPAARAAALAALQAHAGHVSDAARALHERGLAAEALPQPLSPSAACQALLRIRTLGPAEHAELIGLLGRGDECGPQMLADAALGALGTPPAEALDGLLKLGREKSGSVRRRAARAIGRMGGNGKRAEGALREWLKDTDEGVAAESALALAGIGAKEAASWDALRLTLERGGPAGPRGAGPRGAAWQALHQLRPTAPVAAKLLQGPGAEARELGVLLCAEDAAMAGALRAQVFAQVQAGTLSLNEARLALEPLRSSYAELRPHLQSPGAQRELACHVAAASGEAWEAALQGALADADPQLVIALLAHGRGRSAPWTGPALALAPKMDDGQRFAVAGTLAYHGFDGAAVDRALGLSDTAQARTAALLLHQAPPLLALPRLNALLAASRSADPRLAQAAVGAIGRMGVRAQAAVPALKALAEANAPLSGDAARAALLRVEAAPLP